MTRGRTVWGFGVVIALCSASTLSGIAEESGIGRIQIGKFKPSGEWSGTIGGIDAVVEGESATVVTLNYELRGKKHLGFETGLSFADVDFLVRVPGAGSAKLGTAFVMPVTFGVNYHFLKRAARADIYLGPTICWAVWGDLRTPDDQTLRTDTEFAIGGQVGVGLKLSEKSRWNFEATVQYLKLQFGDKTIKVDVDPIMLRVGFGRRFG